MSNFSVDLEGKTALITGAGAGSGRAIALALASSGAVVAAADLNIERAESAAEQIERSGGAAIALHADVSNRFQAANMIERTRDTYGGIQILVNAASAFRAEPMLQIDEWDWRRQLEVNVTGTFFCMQLVGRVMADEGGGTIISLTSADALRSTIPAGIGYITGAAGVIGMTRQAARELAKDGIRVNAIAGGNLRDDNTLSTASPSSLLDHSGTRQDIAGAALFLCSDAAQHITGQVLMVDGGRSIAAE